MNFRLTTTVISKTEDRPYGLQNLSQNNQEFHLMSRVCQLCLPQLWSDELSPVNSGREGCVGRAWSGREAGMSQARWTVSMKAGGRRSRYRRSKCLPLGPGERTQRAAPTHTHTHTHMCTLDLAGSERTPPAMLGISPLDPGTLAHGILPAACFLNYTLKPVVV